VPITPMSFVKPMRRRFIGGLAGAGVLLENWPNAPGGDWTLLLQIDESNESLEDCPEPLQLETYPIFYSTTALNGMDFDFCAI
jgi:hypothetical protein